MRFPSFLLVDQAFVSWSGYGDHVVCRPSDCRIGNTPPPPIGGGAQHLLAVKRARLQEARLRV